MDRRPDSQRPATWLREQFGLQRLHTGRVQAQRQRVLNAVPGHLGCLRRPARPCEAPSQEPAQLLIIWPARHHHRQLPDHLTMAAQSHLGLHPSRPGSAMQRLQPPYLIRGERPVSNVRERPPPPQRQRVNERGSGLAALARGQVISPPRHHLFEAGRVDALGLQTHRVGGPTRHPLCDQP